MVEVKLFPPDMRKRFVQASKAGNGGGPSINSKKTVTSEQLFQLREQKRTFDGVLRKIDNTMSEKIQKTRNLLYSQIIHDIIPRKQPEKSC